MSELILGMILGGVFTMTVYNLIAVIKLEKELNERNN